MCIGSPDASGDGSLPSSWAAWREVGLAEGATGPCGPPATDRMCLAAQGPSFTGRKAAAMSSPTRGSMAAERSHLWPVAGQAL